MSSKCFIVTGTDTDVGKPVFAAALTGALDASYWKPVQAGCDADGSGDKERVAQLSGVPAQRILPEAYRLSAPCSPHLAAQIDNVEIDPARLELPQVDGPLIVEGAGGVMVPITRSLVFADLFARWACPVILVARTTLGTINHSLLSIEALRARGVPVFGIAFSGDENAESETIIAELGGVRRLGRLPVLENLNRETLAAAFARNFNIAEFQS